MEQEDGQTKWEYGMNHMDGKDEEEMDDEFFLSFSWLIIYLFLSLTLLHNSMPHIFFNFSDYYLLFFEPHPWACSRGGECNGYGYPFIYILPVQPHPF